MDFPLRNLNDSAPVGTNQVSGGFASLAYDPSSDPLLLRGLLSFLKRRFNRHVGKALPENQFSPSIDCF